MEDIGMERENTLLECLSRFAAQGLLAIVATAHIAAHFLGYSIVRTRQPLTGQEAISWIQTPIAVEKDAQGQPSGYLILGVDAKGYARIGHAPIPPGTPPLPAAQAKKQ